MRYLLFLFLIGCGDISIKGNHIKEYNPIYVVEVYECTVKSWTFGSYTACDVLLSNGEEETLPRQVSPGDYVKPRKQEI